MHQQHYELSVGVSPRMRAAGPEFVGPFVQRALDGDVGEWNDPERIMETVSARVVDGPSAHVFSSEGGTVVVLLRVRYGAVLVFEAQEINSGELQRDITDFGFNPATLQPCN
jgi:hypothetical protein